MYIDIYIYIYKPDGYYPFMIGTMFIAPIPRNYLGVVNNWLQASKAWAHSQSSEWERERGRDVENEEGTFCMQWNMLVPYYKYYFLNGNLDLKRLPRKAGHHSFRRTPHSLLAWERTVGGRAGQGKAMQCNAMQVGTPMGYRWRRWRRRAATICLWAACCSILFIIWRKKENKTKQKNKEGRNHKETNTKVNSTLNLILLPL